MFTRSIALDVLARTGPGLSASGGLIQKIYEVDPLTCPKCSGAMRVISVIEDEQVTEKIRLRRTSPQAPGFMACREPQGRARGKSKAATKNQSPTAICLHRLLGFSGPALGRPPLYRSRLPHRGLCLLICQTAAMESNARVFPD